MLPDCSPHSQLTPLAPRASLGLWNLSEASESSQVTTLAPRGSLDPWSELGVSWSKPNVILGPWVPETFLEPQEAPSAKMFTLLTESPRNLQKIDFDFLSSIIAYQILITTPSCVIWYHFYNAYNVVQKYLLHHGYGLLLP